MSGSVSTTVSCVVRHNPRMFSLPSLQLCRQFHTPLTWLSINAQRKRTGSERLVLRFFLFLSVQSNVVCYHLQILHHLHFVCVLMCVLVTAWNLALQCESSPDKMRDFFVLSYQASVLISFVRWINQCLLYVGVEQEHLNRNKHCFINRNVSVFTHNNMCSLTLALME